MSVQTGNELLERELTGAVIGAFYRVYNKLGPGFLEAPYVAAMEKEMLRLGLRVGREVGVRIYYDGEPLVKYRLDMLINEKLVLEIKSSHELHQNADRQLFNYLRATNLELGLLLHFGPRPVFHRLYCPNHRKEKITKV